MWQKFHLAVFIITYFIGVGSSIYLIGKVLNKIFNYNIGSITVIIIQCIAFYSLTKVEEYLKECGIEEYKKR